MREGSERWHEVSESDFAHERAGLAHVRELLPDRGPFHAWSNFEFRDSQGKWHEVDLLVLGEGRLHLVELKHYQGRISGDAYRWQRGNRSEDSPVLLARRKAQRLASVLKDAARDAGVRPDQIPFVQQSVFLHATNTVSLLRLADQTDLFGLDGLEDKTNLPSIVERLLEPADPGRRVDELAVIKAVKQAGFAVRREREVGTWRLIGEPLAEGEGWQDWPAEHKVTQESARIRFFVSKPGASQNEVAARRHLAQREYTLTARLQHEHVLKPRDIVDDQLGTGLVFDHDPKSRRLDLWLADSAATTTLADQVGLIRQLAEALHYVHGNHVVHRALNPSAVTVSEGRDGRVDLQVGDWQVAGVTDGADSRLQTGTATRIFGRIGSPTAEPEDRLAEVYVAPEGQWVVNLDRVRLDVFALGAVAYLIVTGQPPATSAADLRDRLNRDRGLDIVADLPSAPAQLRELILESTRPGVSERLRDVGSLLSRLADVERELGDAGRGVVDPLEARPGTLLGSRFELVRRLGSGSTAVGLLVKDSESDDRRVLKVALDDSAAKRLRDEAEVLAAFARKGYPRIVRLVEPEPLQVGDRLGRRAQLWHGDTGAGQRNKIRRDPPDILLTTPESLEAMLVSTKMEAAEFFATVRAVVVDEVHAFAGDDRGWHLLAVLERVSRLARRPLQRVGLSATVGNPDELITWLQGSPAAVRPAAVVAPGTDTRANSQPSARPPGEVTLDHVGSLDNAAKVIAALHAGEKRLVFCDSRRAVEELAHDLRVRGVVTFVSHSSLSVDERRRAEHAFAEARDCVIVSTSTLELGIDVGDLDRVVQIDSPRTVASFLQRIGRTGRRPGTSRNALFLTTDEDSLLQAAGLLLLWTRGFVEPVVPPPAPRHIAAQQLLALALQAGHIGDDTWREWWGGLGIFDETAPDILDHLVATGHLETDQGMLFIGPEAELRFGRRNFMDLLSVFVASPEFAVLLGREELGSVDPIVLTRKVDGPRLVVLAGRSWRVTHIDWKRRRCYVEPDKTPASMRWVSEGLPTSFALSRAQREVLLGHQPDVYLSTRAVVALNELRDERANHVRAGANVILREGQDHWWWTWAGARANSTLLAALPDVIDPKQQVGNYRLRLLPDVALRPALWRDVDEAAERISTAAPTVSTRAVSGLKFNEVLPARLAAETLALRAADRQGAAAVMCEPRIVVHGS